MGRSQGIGYAVVKWGKVLDTIVGKSDEDKDGMDEEGNVGNGNSWQSGGGTHSERSKGVNSACCRGAIE